VLQIVPTHWFSWNFTVTDESRPVAEIATNWLLEKGTLTIDGTTYQVYREALISGDFILAGEGSVLALADKPSVFSREFVIRHGGREYTLSPESMIGRTYVLLDGPRQVGSLVPQGIFTRKTAADLPQDLPLPVRLFIVWLALISWRRQKSS
jgi:hypothetical protein